MTTVPTAQATIYLCIVPQPRKVPRSYFNTRRLHGGRATARQLISKVWTDFEVIPSAGLAVINWALC